MRQKKEKIMKKEAKKEIKPCPNCVSCEFSFRSEDFDIGPVEEIIGICKECWESKPIVKVCCYNNKWIVGLLKTKSSLLEVARFLHIEYPLIYDEDKNEFHAFFSEEALEIARDWEISILEDGCQKIIYISDKEFVTKWIEDVFEKYIQVVVRKFGSKSK